MVKKTVGQPYAGNRTYGLKGDGEPGPHSGTCTPDYQ